MLVKAGTHPTGVVANVPSACTSLAAFEDIVRDAAAKLTTSLGVRQTCTGAVEVFDEEFQEYVLLVDLAQVCVRNRALRCSYLELEVLKETGAVRVRVAERRQPRSGEVSAPTASSLEDTLSRFRPKNRCPPCLFWLAVPLFAPALAWMLFLLTQLGSRAKELGG